MANDVTTRRGFIKRTGNAGLNLVCGSTLYRLYKRFLYRLKDPIKIPPESEREDYILPQGGKLVTVETALNSRCTSDYDGDPCFFHWGMFDPKKKITQASIKAVVELARPPRFTDSMIKVKRKDNLLTFVIENISAETQYDWVMIESGMQQQLVALLCAALGIGMVFRGLGDEGTLLSSEERATVSMKLDAMKPSYDGSYWTRSSPTGPRGWLKGNLPEPDRKGNVSLLPLIPQLQTHLSEPKIEQSFESVSQLLWASRGRTPHFYKGRPWGMTIPVSRGDQDISDLFLILDDILYRYVNWSHRRPTHSLHECRILSKNALKRLTGFLGIGKYCLVWARNERSGRALWEIGYQITNVLLQATALKCSYKVVLLNNDQKNLLEQVGIKDPVASMLVW